MVVLTNEGVAVREPRLVRACHRCRQLRWQCEFPSVYARRCNACNLKVNSGSCQNCGTRIGLRNDGKRRKFCSAPACVQVRYLDTARRAGVRRSKRIRALKTKRCAICHVHKPRTREFFDPQAYDPGTDNIAVFHAYCRGCRAAYARERKLRKAGQDVVPHLDVMHENGGPPLPAQPLMVAIDEWMAREGLSDVAAAALIGTADRRFREWRHGGNTRLAIADAALVAMDLLWFDVWPEDQYPDVAAIWEG